MRKKIKRKLPRKVLRRIWIASKLDSYRCFAHRIHSILCVRIQTAISSKRRKTTFLHLPKWMSWLLWENEGHSQYEKFIEPLFDCVCKKSIHWIRNISQTAYETYFHFHFLQWSKCKFELKRFQCDLVEESNRV